MVQVFVTQKVEQMNGLDQQKPPKEGNIQSKINQNCPLGTTPKETLNKKKIITNEKSKQAPYVKRKIQKCFVTLI